MKQLSLLFACTLFSIVASAQAGSLTVQNLTGCQVWFVIRGSAPGTCNIDLSSSIISLLPGNNVSYPTSASIPGFPATTSGLTVAYSFDRPPSCFPPGANNYRVGEPCMAIGQSVIYPQYNSGCTMCDPDIRMQWTPASSPGGPAILRFLPFP